LFNHSNTLKNPVLHFSDLDLNGRYTYADYLSWKFEEMVELIKGRIFKMSPAPNSFHQSISMNLSGIIKSKLKGSQCKPFAAPTDVRLITKSSNDEDIITVVQPDIFVVCDPSKIDERGCLGSPDFIIEILSPSTSARDLNEKYHLYEEAGVKEYWVIGPGERFVECFVLENGTYKMTGVYGEDEVLPMHILPGVEMSTIEIFER